MASLQIHDSDTVSSGAIAISLLNVYMHIPYRHDGTHHVFDFWTTRQFASWSMIKEAIVIVFSTVHANTMLTCWKVPVRL